MLAVLKSAWALLFGMFLLMIGNGLQGTLLGVRGEYEGFSTFEMSVVMSAYFAGFLFASRAGPRLIRRVGHVRVFAALGSTISAIFILYPVLLDPWAWVLGRIAMGFCFCGVYITAESWLNNAADNANRGKALSLYMVVQMGGIVAAQYVLLLADVTGYVLFIAASVLVSLAFLPVLLTDSGATPSFEQTKPLPMRRLIAASPLACMGMLLLGSVFAAQFGMASVYGTRAGLSLPEISVMISAAYIAALILQYPIGWISDRVDRRILICALAALGGAGAAVSVLFPGEFGLIVASSAIVGGTSNPLYALLIAYANDYLDREDMAGASGGLLFINGLGAVAGPIVTGKVMDQWGPEGFWLIIAVLMLALAGYAVWRMRASPGKVVRGERTAFASVAATASAVGTTGVVAGAQPGRGANRGA